MKHFDVSEPIKIPVKDHPTGARLIDKEAYELVIKKLGTGLGCYLFCYAAPRAQRMYPIYAGKAGNGFRSRVLDSSTLRKVEDRINQSKKRVPYLILMNRRNGVGRPTQKNILKLEKTLIYSTNYYFDTTNKHHTKKMYVAKDIDALVKSEFGKGRPPIEERALRAILCKAVNE